MLWAESWIGNRRSKTTVDPAEIRALVSTRPGCVVALSHSRGVSSFPCGNLSHNAIERSPHRANFLPTVQFTDALSKNSTPWERKNRPPGGLTALPPRFLVGPTYRLRRSRFQLPNCPSAFFRSKARCGLPFAGRVFLCRIQFIPSRSAHFHLRALPSPAGGGALFWLGWFACRRGRGLTHHHLFSFDDLGDGPDKPHQFASDGGHGHDGLFVLPEQ